MNFLGTGETKMIFFHYEIRSGGQSVTSSLGYFSNFSEIKKIIQKVLKFYLKCDYGEFYDFYIYQLKIVKENEIIDLYDSGEFNVRNFINKYIYDFYDPNELSDLDSQENGASPFGEIIDFVYKYIMITSGNIKNINYQSNPNSKLYCISFDINNKYVYSKCILKSDLKLDFDKPNKDSSVDTSVLAMKINKVRHDVNMQYYSEFNPSAKEPITEEEF